MATAKINKTIKEVTVKKEVETVVVEMSKVEAAVVVVVLGALSFSNLRASGADNAHGDRVHDAICRVLGGRGYQHSGLSLCDQEITASCKRWIDSFKDS